MSLRDSLTSLPSNIGLPHRAVTGWIDLKQIKDALQKLRERGHNTVAIDVHVTEVERHLRQVLKGLGPEGRKLAVRVEFDGEELTEAEDGALDQAEARAEVQAYSDVNPRDVEAHAWAIHTLLMDFRDREPDLGW